jgi:hypothetical protein
MWTVTWQLKAGGGDGPSAGWSDDLEFAGLAGAAPRPLRARRNGWQ